MYVIYYLIVYDDYSVKPVKVRFFFAYYASPLSGHKLSLLKSVGMLLLSL
jgi:hypothetical protein